MTQTDPLAAQKARMERLERTLARALRLGIVPDVTPLPPAPPAMAPSFAGPPLTADTILADDPVMAASAHPAPAEGSTVITLPPGGTVLTLLHVPVPGAARLELAVERPLDPALIGHMIVTLDGRRAEKLALDMPDFGNVGFITGFVPAPAQGTLPIPLSAVSLTLDPAAGEGINARLRVSRVCVLTEPQGEPAP